MFDKNKASVRVIILFLIFGFLFIFELVLIVKDNGKSFALYILDLLVRCKLQKVVLHCSILVRAVSQCLAMILLSILW